jgi:hypothetical protein
MKGQLCSAERNLHCVMQFTLRYAIYTALCNLHCVMQFTLRYAIYTALCNLHCVMQFLQTTTLQISNTMLFSLQSTKAVSPARRVLRTTSCNYLEVLFTAWLGRRWVTRSPATNSRDVSGLTTRKQKIETKKWTKCPVPHLSSSPRLSAVFLSQADLFLISETVRQTFCFVAGDEWKVA